MELSPPVLFLMGRASFNEPIGRIAFSGEAKIKSEQRGTRHLLALGTILDMLMPGCL